MLLSDHLDPERIGVPLRGTTKEEVLEELVRLAVPEPARQGETLEALMRREAIQSTGVGEGVAIPHCIAPIGAEFALSAGLSKEGVDFGSSDGSLARIFFLVVSSPGGRSHHLRLLSSISHLLGRQGVRGRLLDARSPQEFLKILLEEEAAA